MMKTGRHNGRNRNSRVCVCVIDIDIDIYIYTYTLLYLYTHLFVSVYCSSHFFITQIHLKGKDKFVKIILFHRFAKFTEKQMLQLSIIKWNFQTKDLNRLKTTIGMRLNVSRRFLSCLFIYIYIVCVSRVYTLNV